MNSKISTETKPKLNLLFDTTYHTRESKCQNLGDIYRIVKDEDYPKPMERIVTEGSDDQPREEDEDCFVSTCHTFATKPKVLSYYDMARWVFDHINMETKIVVNDGGLTIALFYFVRN